MVQNIEQCPNFDKNDSSKLVIFHLAEEKEKEKTFPLKKKKES